MASDKNVITVDQVRVLLKQFYDGREVPESKVTKLMARLDSDNNGIIEWEEFKLGIGMLLHGADISHEPEIGIPTWNVYEEKKKL